MRKHRYGHRACARFEFCATIPLAWILMCCGQAAVANTAPTITQFPELSSVPLVADGSTPYTVTMAVNEAMGYDDIRSVRVLFNFTLAGGDPANGRGYLAWGKDDSEITRFGGNWALDDAGGGGRWGYYTDSWGGTTYIQPLSCVTSVSGSASGSSGSRTVTWTFIPQPEWIRNPIINRADAWADNSLASTDWLPNPVEFEVVGGPCAFYAQVPRPPVLSNPTSNSVDLAVHPDDSATDLFCIRISPSTDGGTYVQADGSVGAAPVWRTRDQWATNTVTGLTSETTYSFAVKAIPTDEGCASEFGEQSTLTTGIQERSIVTSMTSSPMHIGVVGNATRLDTFPSGVLSWNKMWEVLEGTCARGLAGGLCADTYNWKDMSAQGGGHTGTPGPDVPTTLAWMRLARDHKSMALLTANTRGIGPLSSSGWCRFYYTDTNLETVKQLAADWVRYVNFILPTYRQGDVLPPSDQAIVDSIDWYGRPKLLEPGETATPKVTYWEIGNEPELGLPWCTDGATIVHFSPAEFANRYKQITQAMRAVDPSIKVGPCITTANNGNAYLDAVLADQTNQVDFVSYHPYGPLYWYANTYGDTPETAERGLRVVRSGLIQAYDGIVARIQANGRSLYDTALMASEWNSSDWKWEGSPQIRRMSHALGVAETLLTYGEQGLIAANYWSHPAWVGDGTETPGYKVFKMALQKWGDRFVESYSDGHNLRMYTIWNSATSELIIWVLNFSETTDKTVLMSFADLGAFSTVRQHRLAMLNGPTSLFDTNEPPYTTPPNIDWTESDLSDQFDSSDFTMVFPKATITVLTIKRGYRTLPDQTPVSIPGRVVTALFPSDGCFYVAEPDRTFGIRVVASPTGLSVGDLVDINGTVTSRILSGVASERQISNAVVTKVGQTTPLGPLAMNCRSVGGAPIEPFVAGASEGAGPNNIGLPARIAGRVTFKAGQYIYVDDGSNIVDVSGRVGVMVKCQSTSIPVNVGDIAMVTGIIQGSVPSGWTTNRRFIQTRTTSDVQLIGH